MTTETTNPSEALDEGDAGLASVSTDRIPIQTTLDLGFYYRRSSFHIKLGKYLPFYFPHWGAANG